MCAVDRDIPIAEVTTWTNWGTQAQWLALIEIVTALLVMPLFAVLLRLSQTLGWRNLLKVFVTSAALFAAGDLLTTWWCVSHPDDEPLACQLGRHSAVGMDFCHPILLSGHSSSVAFVTQRSLRVNIENKTVRHVGLISVFRFGTGSL